jgi:F0F1-type ATP synthase assembly protein I
MPEQTPERKNKPVYTKWLGFGIEFGGVIAIFCYIGYRLDASLKTSPYLLLVGFFLSFAGMLYLTYKQINDTRRK